MPEDAIITFEAGELPEGICFQSEQERFNTFVYFLSGFLPGDFTAWNIGTSQPTVDNIEKPWLKINADGSWDNVYTFRSGAWVAPYWPPPSSDIRLLWSGTTGDLQTFDGGTVAAVTDTTGPFWEVDTNFTDRVPIGAGATAVNVNANVLTAGATQSARGVYFIRRTARRFRVG